MAQEQQLELAIEAKAPAPRPVRDWDIEDAPDAEEYISEA